MRSKDDSDSKLAGSPEMQLDDASDLIVSKLPSQEHAKKGLLPKCFLILISHSPYIHQPSSLDPFELRPTAIPNTIQQIQPPSK